MDFLSDHGYTYTKFLGAGGFGRVFLCKDRKGQNVCIKTINKEATNLKLINCEIYILSQLNHPRIIRFIDCFHADNTINIVMEYATEATLRSFLDREKTHLSQEVLLKIFNDILMGLEYLHIRRVIHRDLKPENVLICQEGRMKICDFGISAIHDKHRINKDRAGTILYIAPEVLIGNEYDFKADIWSLGCIFYELCRFQTPFSGIQNMSQIVKIVKNACYEKINCSNLGYSNAVRSLCGRMLTFDPKKRVATPDIVRDPLIMLSYYNLYFDYYH